MFILQKTPDETARWGRNEVKPVATLVSFTGAKIHIVVHGHSYVTVIDSPQTNDENGPTATYWLTEDIIKAIQSLPSDPNLALQLLEYGDNQLDIKF